MRLSGDGQELTVWDWTSDAKETSNRGKQFLGCLFLLGLEALLAAYCCRQMSEFGRVVAAGKDGV
jgi:hypothetical protein